MANDVVKRGNGGGLPNAPGTPAMIVGRSKPVGLEEFSYRELGMEPQILQIIHAIRNRNDPGHPGDFKMGQQIYTDPVVVFLKGHHFRTLLEGPEDRPRTVCASSDGINPHAEVPTPKAEHCGTCPYGQWRNGEGGKRIAPPCQPGVAFLGLIVQGSQVQTEVQPGAAGLGVAVQVEEQADVPFWLLCRKTAYKPAMAFGKEVGQRNVDRMSRLLVQLCTEENKSDTGGLIWYTPIFKVLSMEGTEIFNELSDAVQEIRYIPPATASSVPEGGTPSGSTPATTWEVPF